MVRIALGKRVGDTVGKSKISSKSGNCSKGREEVIVDLVGVELRKRVGDTLGKR